MSNKKIIGQGKISTVYKEDGFAFKSYPDQYDPQWVKQEVQIQQEVYSKTSINVVKSEYVAESNEIKMSYIEGITLAERIKKEKYKYGLEDLVDLQCSIYRYTDLNLERASLSFQNRIQKSNLSREHKDKAMKILSSVEEKTCLCHFDFHFLNIMYDGHDYCVIDWVNAQLAHPVMDIARTYIILRQYAQRMSGKYLKLMTQKSGYDLKEVTSVIPLMAMLRLLEKDGNDFSEVLYHLIDNPF